MKVKITEILTQETYDVETGELVMVKGIIRISSLKIDAHIDTKPNSLLRQTVEEMEELKRRDR